MNKIESPEFVEECLTLAYKAPYSWNLRADLCDIDTKDGFLASALEVIPRLARSHKALAEKHGKFLALSMRQMSELHSEIDDLRTDLVEANAKLTTAKSAYNLEVKEKSRVMLRAGEIHGALQQAEAKLAVLRTEVSEARRDYVEAVDHRHTLRTLLDEANVHCACIDAERGIALQELAAAEGREMKLREALAEVRTWTISHREVAFIDAALAPAADAVVTGRTIVSPEGAAIRVTEIHLSDNARAGLNLAPAAKEVKP